MGSKISVVRRALDASNQQISGLPIKYTSFKTTGSGPMFVTSIESPTVAPKTVGGKSIHPASVTKTPAAAALCADRPVAATARTRSLTTNRAIHDAVQVIAYFNYVTRVADALGVQPETFIPRWGAPELRP